VDSIVVAAGSALVGAMATDAWGQARAAVVGLWRRVRPEDAKAVDEALAELRVEVLTAREARDADTEKALMGSWQVRLQQLVRADPALSGELRRVLDEELRPILLPGEQTRIGKIVMQGAARGNGRVYQAGRDQQITKG
jgi:hypothetical protein